jgi:hypothetical protein
MVIHQNQVTILHLTGGHYEWVTDDSDRAAWLSGARSYLRDADPVLARLIDDRPDFDPRAWISQLPPMDVEVDVTEPQAGGGTALRVC